MSKIGLLTIGQSPRVDFTRDIENILKENTEIIELGILDKFNYKEIEEKFYPDEEDIVFVSRMKDGRQVKMGREKILPLLQESINKLNKMKCDLILLLCTGKFPEFKSDILLIEPEKLIHPIVENLASRNKIAILIPDDKQIKQTEKMWRERGVDCIVKSYSPYIHDDSIEKKIKELKKEDVKLIYLDCIGYSVEMKNKIYNETEIPTIVPRILATRIVNELL